MSHACEHRRSCTQFHTKGGGLAHCAVNGKHSISASAGASEKLNCFPPAAPHPTLLTPSCREKISYPAHSLGPGMVQGMLRSSEKVEQLKNAVEAVDFNPVEFHGYSTEIQPLDSIEFSTRVVEFNQDFNRG
eukprot:1152973-Pelagomonas_calceolata.AAC.1